MRTKKAIINVLVSVITFVLGYIPQFIIRRFFLDVLGEDYLGVSSLYTSVIGYLAIAELGIGTAIIFSLYKPYQEKDRKLVSQLMNFYGKVYRIVGFTVAIIGSAATFILPYLIKNNPIGLTDLRICYLLTLLYTVMSYFFTYKQCLISVAQDNYILSIGNTVSKILICIAQILSLKIFRSFQSYLIAQIVVQLIYYIILNRYIDRRFDWIDKNEKILDGETKQSLFKNIKALFAHKIGGLLVNGTDNVLLSAMISLSSVARYNSYNLVLQALKSMYGTTMDTLTPSIGNLLVEKDSDYALKVHDRIYFLTFWLTSIIVITCYNCLSQFVVLWMGKSQLLDNFTLNCVFICTYFALMRTSVEKFKDGSGNFSQDRYAPLIEGVLNLIISIVALKYLGMAGVFLGTVISDFLVIFWTKPNITYKYVFKCSPLRYYKEYAQYVAIFLINLVIVRSLTHMLADSYTILSFCGNVVLNVILINILLYIWFRKKEEFIYYKQMIITKFLKRG